MSNRITITNSDLERLVKRINEATGNALEYSTKGDDGKYITHIGNYHLDYAYGGVRLVQTMNDGGGIRVISTCGYGTKRELYQWLQAYLAGLSTESKAS